MATTPHQPHSNTQFQLERLILFSDAVFAIAITLLIIEIKVPHIEGKITNVAISHALQHQIPEWIGFFISFWVIGIYWMAHHRMFGYVIGYKDGLIPLNLLFLMTIVIMPFSSALYSNYLEFNTSYVFYALNVAVTGFCLMLLWRYITNPKHEISKSISLIVRQHGYVRNAVAPVVFLLSALVALMSSDSLGIVLSRSMFFLIFITQAILGRVYKPKIQAVHSEVHS